ncbi:MAG: hypothetical protein ACQXXD_04325, partial [Thermoplasmatota archaeon]
MKKTILAIILFATFLMVVQPVYAHIFRLSSNKTIYNLQDEIIINLEVKNTMSIEKTMEIYITIEEENNRYPPQAWYYPITLSPDETRNLTVYRTNVSDYLVNGEYVVYAQLMEDGFALYEDEVRFTITGLPETMNVDLLVSNDSKFRFTKDVFLVDEIVYIGYSSSVEDVEINCMITYPNNSFKTVTLPYSFTSNEVGLYSLSIIARKEGYRNFTKSMQFAVIEK